MFEPYRLLSPIFLLIGGYIQIREHQSNLVLDLADHYLLICNHILLISVLIGGWIMQVVYYSVLGTHIYIGVIISRYSRNNQTNDSLFNTILINLCLGGYLLLKVFTQKSNYFGTGQMVCGIEYQSIAQSLDGWNCTYGQFSVLSFIWLVEQIYSIKIGLDIIKEQPDVDHRWKNYFINRKIKPTILFLLICFAYNLCGYIMSTSPLDCMNYWVGSTSFYKILIHIIKIIIYIGPSAATLLFYHFTLPYFRRQVPANSLQQQLLF